MPLGHHVDYWDRLGWTDPFSSERATDRQRNYQALGGGVYTPQAVIDGNAQMVGSRRAALEAAVAEAAKKPHATIGIDVAPRTEPNAPSCDARYAWARCRRAPAPTPRPSWCSRRTP